MKYIQIIDGADNATYSIFQASDDEFAQLFQMDGQDILFSTDIKYTKRTSAILDVIWTRPILKKDANGIHGTIFYNAEHRRENYPVSRRMIDMDQYAVNHHEAALHEKERQRIDALRNISS